MEYIKGFTFGWMSGKGAFRKPEAKESLRLMAERTGSSHVIFALAAHQDHPQAVEVKYRGVHLVDDDELIDMMRYARELGLRVILKPTVNCTDGTWRAHINFFDIDVPCEPKWKDWFRSYTAFQKHYAAIAEQEKCEMFIVGCEMVQSERRDQEWREVIAGVREVYTGLVSYNTDKYQEDHVKWWDAVDVISSSGYYPIGDWEAQLDRIEEAVAPYGKPFFLRKLVVLAAADQLMYRTIGDLQVRSARRNRSDSMKPCSGMSVSVTGYVDSVFGIGAHICMTRRMRSPMMDMEFTVSQRRRSFVGSMRASR